VIFFDATTLYFESFSENDLMPNGYSEDLKFNQPQVLFALLVTKQGLPIGYEVFPGATYEGRTLIPVLQKIRRRCDLDKVIFVADRGMLSSKNLKFLEENGFEYIISARLRGMKNSLQKQILDIGSYRENGEIEGERIGIKELALEDQRRLIVSFSAKRAAKERHDREASLRKLQEKLKRSKRVKQLITNHGYKKYLKVKGNSEALLDEEKIVRDSRWDGLHGIITNNRSLSNEEIIHQYRMLWQWRKMSPEAIRTALVRIQTTILKGENKMIFTLFLPQFAMRGEKFIR